MATCSRLKRNGAQKVYIIATHGILSGNAPEIVSDEHRPPANEATPSYLLLPSLTPHLLSPQFDASPDVDFVIVTNSIDQEEHQARCSKLRVIGACWRFPPQPVLPSSFTSGH